jgi:hypothetical protein
MKNELLCTVCGYQGKPKLKTKGSIGVELILWLFLIIPGLIYSIWRHTNSYKCCPICGSCNMIPLTSPKARQILSASRESLSTAAAESPENSDNP